MVDTVYVTNSITPTVKVSVNDHVSVVDSIASSIVDSKNALLSVANASFDKITDISECTTIISKASLETFWGMSIPVAQFIVPTVISLFTFVLGIVINIVWDQYKKKIKSQCLTLDNHMTSLDKIVNDYIENVRSFIDRNNDNKSFQLDTFPINSIPTSIIKSYSLNDLMSMFVFNRKGDKTEKSKNANTILISIEFIEEAQKEVLKKYYECQDESARLLEQWNIHANEIGDFNAKSVTLGINNDVCSKFSSLVKPLLNDDKTDIKDEIDVQDWYEKVYSPMLTWCSWVSLNEKSDRLLHYEESLRKMKQIYNQRNALHEGYLKIMKEYADKIQTSYNNLKNSSSILASNKYVCLLKIQ